MHRLRPPIEREAFVARIVSAGAARNLDLAPETVHAAIRAGEARWHAPGVEPPTTPSQTPPNFADRLFGWIPFRLDWAGGAAFLDWCHLDGRRMVEPRLADTIGTAMREPFNLVFSQRTPVEALASLPAGLPVAGLIFDAGVSGTMPASEMFAAFESNIVVADAQPLGAALRSADRIGREGAARWLAGLANAYAQPRFGYERRLIIALTPGEARDVTLMRLALPDVPWVVIGRDPTAALSAGASAGADRLGLILDPGAWPDALWTDLPTHFGLRLDDGAVAAVAAMARRHSARFGEGSGPTLASSDGRLAARPSSTAR